MLSKAEIIDKAHNLGFEDIGFTTAEPFTKQKEILFAKQEEYSGIFERGVDLLTGTDPKQVLPTAKSIIVLIEVYFREAFPPSLERYFGRCYLDDDRTIKDRLYQRVKAFRGYLRDHGIDSKVPFNLPHRLAAARAGLGNFGKNCLFYSNKVARKSSWVLPLTVVVDHDFSPDKSTEGIGCPKWCKNACIVACPMGALKPRKINPPKCISYLTYFGEGITPKELREPMGLWIYGCDRCQDVCPRNKPWLAKELPINKKAAAMTEDFTLSKLLHMNHEYFASRIWPHMFYNTDLDKWKMNVARTMGNTLDQKYIPDLIRAFRENQDERVRAMTAWALGRIGGVKAKSALEKFLSQSEGVVYEEVSEALAMIDS